MSKVVLIAVLVQAVPLPATSTDPAATAIFSTAITAEYDDAGACINAAKSIANADAKKLVGFTFSCSPKAVGKLEVVPPVVKPKDVPPVPIPRGNTSS